MAAGIVTSNNFVTGTAIKSGENASFPASNVAIYTRANWVWKDSAAVSTAKYIGYDFGSAKAIRAVVVDNINVDSIHIEADDASTFDSNAGLPQYSSAYFTVPAFSALTVSQDPVDGRYKICHRDAANAVLFTRRYMRVRSATSSTVDGATVMSCGSIAAFTATTEWAVNPGYAYVRQPLDPAKITDFVGGIHEVTGLGFRSAEVTFAQSIMPTSMESTILGVLAYGQHNPFVFYRNYGTRTYEVYIGWRVGEAQLRHEGPNHHVMGAWVMRECA